MKFELDAVPAVVGVGIYVSCQLLLRALAPRTKKSKEPQEAALLKEGTKPFEDIPDNGYYGVQREPEPVPEPAGEPAEEPAEEPAAAYGNAAKASAAQRTAPCRRAVTALWFALAFMLILSRATLPMWSPGSAGLLQWPVQVRLRSEGGQPGSTPVPAPELSAPPAAPGHATHEAPRASSEAEVEADSEAADWAPEEPAPALPGPEAPAAEESPGDGNAAFSVKLTRQVMNDENYVRSAYYGTLQIGTPAIAMTVVFDTGSGHLVLPSMYCKSETCKAHTRYRRSGSESARDIGRHGNTWLSGPRDSVTVSFGTGEITGVYVEDLVCLSGVANVSSQAAASGRPECLRLHFVAATALSEDPFKSFHFDGILGLGLSGLSQTSRFNFMEVMAESIRGYSGRSPHTFGVFLGDHEYEDSEIALGGWAKEHLREDLSWGPVHDPEMGHWILPISGLRVDGERMDFCDDGQCRAAVDTGTSLLAVPTAAFREMYELLRHPAPLAGHCRGFGPLLHFELDHFTVSLGPRDYGQVKKTHRSLLPKAGLREGKGPKGRPDLRCLPMLMTMDMEEPIGPKLFVLGEPVLRKYYSVYDGYTKRVGLARAKHVKSPPREDLLEQAAGLEPVARRRMPTMFDVFRWRKALQ